VTALTPDEASPMGRRVRYSARQLAELLHTDGQSAVQYPTEDQARVIEAPLEPLLVIAGAGSGKTKTMADRVVWLVANDLVRPEQILGVTFTRKAAGELSSRVRQRLTQLYSALGTEATSTAQEVHDHLDPMISTYHSFANGIVQDYGLRIGVERDSVMLGTAQSWQLAHAVVEAYDGEWEHFTAAKSTLVKAVLGMAGDCAEHLVSPSVVRQELRRTIDHVTARSYVAGSAEGARVARQAAHPRHCDGTRRAVRCGEAGAPTTRFRGSRLAGGQDRPRHPGRGGNGAREVPRSAARRVPGHLPRADGAVLPAVRRWAGRHGRR
jgi:hypothetical protein